MVFPRPLRPERDPEEQAEEELNRRNGNPTTPPASLPKPAEKSEDAISQGSSTSNGSDAQCCSSSKVHPSKESKAERKKRSRGVSGSSIKKDGGKFDLGLEDFDDLEINSEDEEEAYQDAAYHAYGNRENHAPEQEVYYEPEPEPEVEAPPPEPEPIRPMSSEDWQDGLMAMAKTYHPRVGYIVLPLVRCEETEARAVQRLYDELHDFFEQNFSGILSDDLYNNYLLATGIAQGLFEDRMINGYRYFEFYRDCPPIINGHRNHVLDFLKYVKKVINKFSNNPMIPQPPERMVVPREDINRMAKEFCEEHNTEKIAEQLQNLDIAFHSYFIYQTCKRALKKMSMDLMYFIVSAFKELYDNCVISHISIRLGFCKLSKDAIEIEKKLDSAAALLHLFSSYAMASLPVTDECFNMLPPPKHFLTTGANGMLVVSKPTGDLPNLSVKNYFLLN